MGEGFAGGRLRLLSSGCADKVPLDAVDVSSLAAALAALEDGGFDLVVCGHGLRDGTALDLLATQREVPVAVVVPEDDELAGILAIRGGAIDALALAPGSDAVALTGLTIERARRQRRDLTERDRAARQLSLAALHDPLTRLPNRALFMDRLSHAVQRGRRDETAFGVIFIDLDRFKIINDDFGHAAGDQVLRAVGRRLASALREGDTVARLGGDEFAVLLESLDDPDTARQVAVRAGRVLARPIAAAGTDLFVEASLGVAVAGAGSRYDAADEILRDADTAMYRAKPRPGTRYVMFEPSMRRRPAATPNLEEEIQRALDRNQLVLHYQPIFDLRHGRLCGFEALVRWHHPRRGLLLPIEFLPAASDVGLSPAIGAWVLRRALEQAAAWRRLSRQRLTMTVNLDDAMLRSTQLLAVVAEALRASRVPGSCLELDVSESVVQLDAERAASAFGALQRAAVGFAIDDFGTSASSIDQLHRLPIDTLKIDRSLIGRIGVDEQELRVVRTIVALARQLDLRVTAEGIETVEQLALLRTLGCDSGQGHLFGRAVGPGEAARMIDRGAPELPRFIVQPT